MRIICVLAGAFLFVVTVFAEAPFRAANAQGTSATTTSATSAPAGINTKKKSKKKRAPKVEYMRAVPSR